MRKLGLMVTVIVTGLAFMAAARDIRAQQTEAPAIVAPQDRPTRAQLSRLFETMGLRTQVESMMNSVVGVVQQAIQPQIDAMEAKSGTKLTPEQRATIDEFLRKAMIRAQALYPVEEMIDDSTTIYQRYLTRNDVEAINTFYASPAGQKLLSTQPVIMQEYLPIVMQRISTRLKTFQEDIQKDVEELKKQMEPMN